MRPIWIIAVIAVLACASCSQRWGVYAVRHVETLPNGYVVRTLRSHDRVRCQYLLDDRIVAELDVFEGEIKAVAVPYEVAGESRPDNMTMFCDGTNVTTVRMMTKGDASVTLFDMDNDGLPEKRQTSSPDGHKHESIAHSFTIEE